jgi:16S rRNA (cytosine967-C5)-methyltransferase
VGHPEKGPDAAADVGVIPAARARVVGIVVDVETAATGRPVTPGPDERRLARAALRRILDEGAPTLPTLGEALRDAVDNDGRRRLKDLVVGVAVRRLRLAFLVARAGVTTDGDARIDALIDAFLADDDARDDVVWSTDPVEAMSRRRSCPPWLTATLIADLGHDDADAFLAAANHPGPVTLRANTLRTTRAALLDSLATDGISARALDVTPWAVEVVGHANLTGCAAWRDAHFEVQDTSSQQVVVAAGARPGDVVVDLCAGRGGKTLALAACMEDRGRLLVHDVDERALRDLRGRVRRLGLRCVEETAPEAVAGQADIVVVDAPCSSLGVLRRSPDLRYRLRPDDIAALAPVQRGLLERAARLVRPGGRVVYGTCSVLRAENGDVADTAADALESESRRLLLPQRDGGDGFFIASWRRR